MSGIVHCFIDITEILYSGNTLDLENLDLDNMDDAFVKQTFKHYMSSSLARTRAEYPDRMQNNMDKLFVEIFSQRLESFIPPVVKQDVKTIVQTHINNQKFNGGIGRSLGLTCQGNCKVPLSLSGIWSYGCWCNFGEDLEKGQGPAVNKHDQICQSMQYCLRCAKSDGIDYGYTCDSQTQKFEADIKFAGDYSENVIARQCEKINDNPCAAQMCMCQVTLVVDLVNLVFDNYRYDRSYARESIGGSFDYEEKCVVEADKNRGIKEDDFRDLNFDGDDESTKMSRNKGNDKQGNKGGKNDEAKPSDEKNYESRSIIEIDLSYQSASMQCCGKYPRRKPYKMKNKICCDSDGRIFNDLFEQCCPRGVAPISDIC